ncbi:hypothetical protein DPMN_018597 [Dreissena polymorpha]|uniref:Uncharacterized protein n=1 Tax=Dreissena polymorpha TaxID=45954 RepID=A0A9D4NFF7_DREPO|nr:hypothetical protein DPMN_018597 [Dreissena polymorpha]
MPDTDTLTSINEPTNCINTFPLRSKVTMAFATSIKPEQPRVTRSLFMLYAVCYKSGLEMKPLTFESNKKGL